jgi:integrase
MGYQKPLYLTTKRGVYYYTRRVPQSLKAQFRSPRFVKCLHTKSLTKAAALSTELSSRLENIWDRMRLELLDFKSSAPRIEGLGSSCLSSSDTFLISDGFDLYLRLKAAAKPEAFRTYTKRNQRYLTECLGDVSIARMSPRNGADFRDHLLEKGLSSSSVRRVFSTIKAVINLCISEHGLQITNPFGGVYIPDDNLETKRRPIPLEDIRRVQAECITYDDDQRWLIALISDTGMRLSEACGLLIEDIKLDAEIPYLDVKPHSWRRLKTKGSARQLPLVGTSLWAANRIVATGSKELAFPRYYNMTKVKANSASGALNKWLSQRVPEGCVVHSFRHSFRDRLREVQCPADMIDALGGWSTAGVGSSYGSGYDNGLKYKWMLEIAD